MTRPTALLLLALALPASAAAQSDFTVTQVRFITTPQPIRIGPCNRAAVQVRNTGAAIARSFLVRLTTMNDVEQGLSATRARRVDRIAGDSTISLMFDGVSAWGGTTLMQGMADAQNEVTESNEQNNRGTGSGTTTATTGYCFGLSVADTAGTEGANLVFTVRRGGSTTESVTVDYATRDGTAIGGPGCVRGSSDFQHVSGTLTFAARETRKQVTVALCNDQNLERAGEAFTLVLSKPGFGAQLTDAEATGTIR